MYAILELNLRFFNLFSNRFQYIISSLSLCQLFSPYFSIFLHVLTNLIYAELRMHLYIFFIWLSWPFEMLILVFCHSYSYHCILYMMICKYKLYIWYTDIISKFIVHYGNYGRNQSGNGGYGNGGHGGGNGFQDWSQQNAPYQRNPGDGGGRNNHGGAAAVMSAMAKTITRQFEAV